MIVTSKSTINCVTKTVSHASSVLILGWQFGTKDGRKTYTPASNPISG